MRRSIGISEKKASKLLSERIRMTLDHFSYKYRNASCDLDKVKIHAIRQVLNELLGKKP